MLVLGGALFASPVEIRASGVATEDAAAIVEALTGAISEVAPTTRVVRAPCAACTDAPLVIEVFEAVTVYRVRATRGGITARVDMPLDRALWAPPMLSLARTLFPEPAPLPSPPPAGPEVVTPSPGWIVPAGPAEPPRPIQYAGIGAGALASVVGVVLIFVSQTRLDDLDGRLAERNGSGLITGVTYEEAAAEHASASGQGDVGIAVVIAGGAVALSSLCWFLLTSPDPTPAQR